MGDEGSRIRVLHVDDEPEFLDVAAEFLEREGRRLEVETATGAAAASAVLDSGRVDCVVSDYDMPGKDGIEFLEMVRADYPELPFILFTGKGSEDLASEAISAGVTDYLQKRTGSDQYAILANRIRNAVDSARAQERAKRSQARFEALSETFPDVAFYISGDGRYLGVLTGSPDELLAASAEDLVGSRFDEVLPAETAERFQDVVDRTLETGEVQSIEYSLEVRANVRWFEARIAPLAGADRDTVLWIARDITGNRAQRETLEQYRQIVETMQEHAAIYDRDGRIRAVNQSLVDVLDTTARELEGSTSRLLPRIREEVPGDPFQALLSGEREEVAGEIEIEFTPTPEVLAYRLTPVRVEDEVEWVVAVTRVVTERREYERLLRAQHDRLEEFAGVLSHDLRNSLNVAESRLELATDECDSDHLDAIESAHARIEEDLDSLLTLARGAGYAIDFESVDPETVSRRAWEDCKTSAASLQVAVDDEIQADPDSFQRLLDHCFSNAVEHGGPDVTVTVGRHPGGFYVEDDGRGVPDADRERILEPGYSGGEAGTGFGLRIVEEIATAHGWDLELAEGTGGGLRLVFEDVLFAD
jgi:PAS domain S-box-containing protein